MCMCVGLSALCRCLWVVVWRDARPPVLCVCVCVCVRVVGGVLPAFLPVWALNFLQVCVLMCCTLCSSTRLSVFVCVCVWGVGTSAGVCVYEVAVYAELLG